MNSEPDTAENPTAEEVPPSSGGKRKLILIAAPILVGVLGAALWFTGIIPGLLGKNDRAHADSIATERVVETSVNPVFVEIPEIVANLNGGGRKTVYAKLKVRLEVGNNTDAARINAAMPRVQDMFQTYIREMRPEDMRGSMGTYRLREELIARAQLAAAPARVRDVLFVEILIQ